MGWCWWIGYYLNGSGKPILEWASGMREPLTQAGGAHDRHLYFPTAELFHEDLS